MKHYNDLSPSLQAALLMVTRGYSHGVTFEVEREKLEALERKFIDYFGVHLPAWKRTSRKAQGLPNSWGCLMPVPGAKHRARVLLLRTDADLEKLHPDSPWRREKWSEVERLEIGDFCIALDKRQRGDYAMTVKLTKRALAGLEAHYRKIASQSLDELVETANRDVRFYPMFGGVRRQMRRLLRGYAKLFEKRRGIPWPGPNPEALPAMGSFKKADGI